MTKKEEAKPRSYLHWVVRIFLISVMLSAALSFVSGIVLEDAGYVLAVTALALFVLLGIVFDVIGVAVTAADPKPFHSMAAHRERGAREALFLLKNAEKVSSLQRCGGRHLRHRQRFDGGGDRAAPAAQL